MFIIGGFFKEMTARNLMAGLIIAVIFSLIVYLIMILVFSYQERRAAVKVRLPAIDSYGEDAFSTPEFKEPKKFVVELIDLNEDAPQNSKPKDERGFIHALTMETGKYIPTTRENMLKMPKVELLPEEQVIEDSVSEEQAIEDNEKVLSTDTNSIITNELEENPIESMVDNTNEITTLDNEDKILDNKERVM